MAVKVIVWKGAYWLDVVHKGQRKRKRVGTGKTGKRAAEFAAIKIAAQLADGNVSVFAPPVPAQVPTFAAVAQEWLQKYPALHSIRPTTLENYRSFTERHLIPYFGSKPITALTTESVEDFIEAKRGPGGSIRFQGKALSDSSLRTGLLALRLILQRAVRTRLIVANPMNEVEWRRQPHIEQVDPFTDTELRAIFRSAPPDLATLLRLWVQAGMRAGEACGLQWQDIDLELGQALVRRTWSRQRLGPTKTGRERLVSFLHPVAEPIADWRPGAGDARSVLAGLRGLKVQSLEPAAFVFGRGKAPLSSMELHRAWKRTLIAARVRYRPPEQLRHTFASTMLSRNAPLLYVQQQGGWRSASVLLRVYSRWMPQEPPAATQLPPVQAPARLAGTQDGA
jgi:integrase